MAIELDTNSNGAIDIERGGTNATTALQALSNLGGQPANADLDIISTGTFAQKRALIEASAKPVSGIANLRLTTADFNGDIRYLTYHTSLGDGGDGIFIWDASSFLSDNNGTAILPTGHVGAGRWVRVLENNTLNVRQAGARLDGSDDTSFLQAAIDSFGDYAGTVRISDGEITIVGTITLREGVKIVGGDGRVAGLNHAKRRPRITHTPTSPNTSLFVLEDTGDYFQGCTVSGLSIYSASVNSVKAFDLYQPMAVKIENCDIRGFVDSISVAGALALTISDSLIGSYSSSGIRFTDDTFVTTTTNIDRVHFISGSWGAVMEEESIIDVTFNGCIFENLSLGAADIYRSNTATVNFNSCYSENVPNTGLAAPIIQIGVNGSSTAATKANVFVNGGTYSGGSSTYSVDSTFITADYAGQISVIGVDIRRVGKLFTTTANTNYMAVYGCTNVSVINPMLGIYDLSRIVGSLPRITSGGYGKQEVRVPKLIIPGGVGLDDAWTLESSFTDTAYDLLGSFDGSVKFRFNNTGQLGLGTVPKANLHVAGTAILGGIGVDSASIGNSEISFYVSESTGNLVVRARKADGTLLMGTVTLAP